MATTSRVAALQGQQAAPKCLSFAVVVDVKRKEEGDWVIPPGRYTPPRVVYCHLHRWGVCVRDVAVKGETVVKCAKLRMRTRKGLWIYGILRTEKLQMGRVGFIDGEDFRANKKIILKCKF